MTFEICDFRYNIYQYHCRLTFDLNAKYVNDKEFIDDINEAQNSWVAGEYRQFETMTNGEILQMAGKRNAKITP